MGFVLELAELLAVGFEPAVEGKAEGAFDSLEVVAAVPDFGVASGDDLGAEGVGSVEHGCGEGPAVATDEVGDGLRRASGETVGHDPSIGP